MLVVLEVLLLHKVHWLLKLERQLELKILIKLAQLGHKDPN